MYTYKCSCVHMFSVHVSVFSDISCRPWTTIHLYFMRQSLSLDPRLTYSIRLLHSLSPGLRGGAGGAMVNTLSFDVECAMVQATRSHVCTAG